MNQTLERIDLDDLFDLDLMVLTGTQLPEAASKLTDYGCTLTDDCPTSPCPTQASSCNSAGQTGRPCHCF